jgi:hypothetical protein
MDGISPDAFVTIYLDVQEGAAATNTGASAHAGQVQQGQ